MIITRRFCSHSLIISFAFAAAAATISGEEFRYDSHGRRNPFLPPSKAEEAARMTREESLVETKQLEAWVNSNLTGVIWDPQAPYALIGDSIVGVGDEIHGCTVVEIRPDSIIFLYKEKRVEVPISTE